MFFFPFKGALIIIKDRLTSFIIVMANESYKKDLPPLKSKLNEFASQKQINNFTG
jgi:hypothetical protein